MKKTVCTIKEHHVILKDHQLEHGSPKKPAEPADPYAWIEARRADCLKQGKFRDYYFTFAGSEGAQAFFRIQDRLQDNEYWELAAIAWTAATLIEPDTLMWMRVLQAKRPRRELLMTADEHAALAAMPDEIQIWRGCEREAHIHGMSWTIDKNWAEWFATRRQRPHAPRVVLASAFCRKSDVLAYFTNRNESEIVINSANLLRVQSEPITWPTQAYNPAVLAEKKLAKATAASKRRKAPK